MLNSPVAPQAFALDGSHTGKGREYIPTAGRNVLTRGALPFEVWLGEQSELLPFLVKYGEATGKGISE